MNMVVRKSVSKRLSCRKVRRRFRRLFCSEAHFRCATENSLTLITKNPDDFLELHEKNSQHAQTLLVYQGNDPDRDMTNGRRTFRRPSLSSET